MTQDTAVSSLLKTYLARGTDSIKPSAAAFYAALDHIATVSPSVASSIINELRDQRRNLKLIASENYCSLATQLAHGNLLTDKYAEGYPEHRFYAGCDNVDSIEAEAAHTACELFGAEHAYVQPHSGADANMVAFIAILSWKIQKPFLEGLDAKDAAKLDRADWNRLRSRIQAQRLLSMDLYSGGHLSHGYRYNFSSQIFDVYHYSVDPGTKRLDLDQLRAQVREVRPLILLAGYSAYPRKIDFAALREMADEVGAVLMVDMAHFAGLVAGKVFTGNHDPVAHSHIVTSTTHKTLRGPRGGIILCRKELSEWVDKGCPAFLGGPLPHAIAAKAVAFREANTPEFRDYARRIVENARALAQACASQSIEVLTGGTDNHLLLLDVEKSFGLSGRQAETALRASRMTLNRNTLPFDKNGPWYTSGLRLGTPAVTTLGMGPEQMKEVAAVIRLVLSNTTAATISKGAKAGERSLARYQLDDKVVEQATARMESLLEQYPVYPEIDLELLLSAPYYEARTSP